MQGETMPIKRYYSERKGLRTGTYDLLVFRKLVMSLIDDLKSRDYLYELLGFDCVDGEHIPAKGGNINAYVLREVGRDDLWPPDKFSDSWSEDAIFDLIEFLGLHVSAGIEETGRFHSYMECGWHFYDFDRGPALDYFASEANKILSRYDCGYELDNQLDVVALPPQGMEHLLNASLPKSVSPANRAKLEGAIQKFRSRASTLSDRGDAVKDLGAVLEYMRPKANKLIAGDASDIFNFLNNYGLRHHNPKQKTGYDPIWLSAMFYHFLTVIHTLTRLQDQQSGNI
jgi:hypothetical protein